MFTGLDIYLLGNLIIYHDQIGFILEIRHCFNIDLKIKKKNPIKIRNKKGYPLVPFNIVLEALTGAIRQEKKMKEIQIEKEKSN